MIKHVVMWNFVERDLDQAAREAHLATIRDAVSGQVGRIPGLVSMTAGLNLVDGPHAMDLVLESEFESLEALLAYHDNPLHHEVRDIVDPLVTDVRGADYEAGGLDDELVARARELTGIVDKGALVRAGLSALIEREAARR